jgi:hypothetical protein
VAIADLRGEVTGGIRTLGVADESEFGVAACRGGVADLGGGDIHRLGLGVGVEGAFAWQSSGNVRDIPDLDAAGQGLDEGIGNLLEQTHRVLRVGSLAGSTGGPWSGPAQLRTAGADRAAT